MSEDSVPELLEEEEELPEDESDPDESESEPEEDDPDDDEDPEESDEEEDDEEESDPDLLFCFRSKSCISGGGSGTKFGLSLGFFRRAVLEGLFK